MSNFIINTVPTNSYTILVSSITSSKIIGLPPASTIPGRIINIKSGNFSSTIRISTTGIDAIDAISTTSTNLPFYAILSTPNTTVTLSSDGISNWMILAQEVGGPILAPNIFSPSSITNPPLSLWFDAADIRYISSSTNNTIARWANKALPSEFLTRSSNAVVGTSSNTNSAITGVHSLYGQNVVRFSTGSEMFINKSLIFNAKSLLAVYVPLDGPSPTNPSTMLIGAPRNVNTFTNTIVYNASTAVYELALRRASINITTMQLLDSTFTLNVPYLFSYVQTTTSNSNVIAEYGLNYQEKPINTNAGGYATGPSNYFINYASFSTSFDLAEILVYDGALSSNDRQRVEGYLAWKWGLNYELFWNGHPFKFVTPLQ